MNTINKCLARLGTLAYKTIGRVVIPLVVNHSDRTRVLLVADSKVLLCKMLISSGKWNIPGGGVKRGESIEAGAIREIQEEVGAKITVDQLVSHGTTQHRSNSAQFTAHLFSVELDTEQAKARWPEIIEVQWFSFDSLPKNINDDALIAIKRYQALVR